MLVIQPDLEPIPGYRLIRQLGRGGCGEVWKAEAPGGVFKAIKFVFGDLDGMNRDNRAAEQEQKSIQRVKNIRHPFILTTERFEIVDGQLVIVMELADRNLAERFDECTAQKLPGIPRDELLRYMEEAAEALDLMNTQYQIQHMDVKPQNIFLVQNHVKVGDFGLAKNLEGNRAALTGGMTPIYAPPESFDGWVSRQSDQYSLAIVYQEMLTGKRPFNGTSTRQLIMQHLTAQPDLSPLPPSDRGPVERALSKVPENRFPSCVSFVRALRGTETGMAPVVRGSAFAKRPVRGTEQQTRMVRRPAPAVVSTGRPTHANVPSRSQPGSSTNLRPVRQGGICPTLVVGIGAIGLAIVQHYRRLLLDRFRVASLPHIRFLYVDTDPAAIEAALTDGPPEHSLTDTDVVLAEMLPKDAEVAETPIAGQTMSSSDRTGTRHSDRSIRKSHGACDRTELLERARAALKHVTDIATLSEATRLTQQDLRSKSPRVYLACDVGDPFTAAVLVDFAYALRTELRKMGLKPEYVIGLLALPACDQSEGLEQAKSTLRQLEYYDRTDTHYKISVNNQVISDSEPPLGRGIFFDNETAVGQAANLLFAETTTGAGSVIQSVRLSSAGRHYSTVGLRRILWPCDLILANTARRLAHETLVSWAAPNNLGVTERAKDIVDQFWRQRHLDPALVRTGIEYGGVQQLGGTFNGLVEDRLLALGIGSGKEGIELLSAEIAINQVAEWLGDNRREDSNVAGRVSAALETRGCEIAGDIDLKLAPLVASMLEKPGQRIAAAREALRILEGRLSEVLSQAERECAELAEEVRAAYNAVRDLISATIPTGKSNSRKATVAGDFASRLTAWAQRRICQLRDKAATDVYRKLIAAIPEFVREIDTLGVRLEVVAQLVDVEPEPGLPDDGVCAYLYPLGAESADDATAELLNAFGDGGRREFDEVVQAKLRGAGKGVIQLGVRSEWGPRLSELLITEASRFVEGKTNRMSVAKALYQHYTHASELSDYLKELLKAAEPAPVPEGQPITFIGVPDDTAGNQLADLLRKFVGHSSVLTFPSQDELVVIQFSAGVSIKAVLKNLVKSTGSGVVQVA